MAKIVWASRRNFGIMLDNGVMPTFDLVLEYGRQGIILVKRIIPPYKNKWALPGLRMLKGESIKDSLERIARQELGLDIDAKTSEILGQYTARFRTEHQRQDLSTGYYIRVDSEQEVRANPEHFSGIRLIKSREEIPSNTGRLYKYHLDKYFKRQEGNRL